MEKRSVKKVPGIEIPSGYSIALTPIEKETVTCEICGAENDAGRELCRVCSNYLKDEEMEK